ncbi:YezD family protein [Sporosarcina sp. FSL K6-3457]|uniref:YezD family protein n=1 Tax=Sporosarcina sp. FSL K6-3457 TaxID=2978204 RepID=UPI0030FC5421
MLDKQMDDQWIERIVQSLKGIQYGSVEIVIHDSKITQIDRLEKQRFPLRAKNLGGQKN